MPELDMKTHEDLTLVHNTDIRIFESLPKTFEIKAGLDERWRFSYAFLEFSNILLAGNYARAKARRGLLARKSPRCGMWFRRKRWRCRRGCLSMWDLIVKSLSCGCCTQTEIFSITFNKSGVCRRGR